jgi:capsular exopolysaccharide synthesis family protein
VEPKDFARVILRRRKTVAVALIAVMATAFFMSMNRAPIYSANCEVLFGAVAIDPTDPSSRPIETLGANLTDQTHFIEGPEIVTRAAKLLRVGVPALGQIHAEPVPNTQTLRITVAQTAARGAANIGSLVGKACNAVANAYITYKQDAARIVYQQILKKNQAAQAQLRQQIHDIEFELEAARGDSNATINLTVSRDTDLQSLSTLQQRGNAIKSQLAAGIDGGPQLTSPAGDGVPSGASRSKDLVLAALVGLMFGIGIALIREYMDDTVRDKESTQKELGLPVLANLPETEEALETYGEPSDATVEAARKLRATLASFGFPQERSVLMITSTMGKTRPTTLASLAAAVAESGRSVLVIGTDLRNGRTHEGFGVANTAGLVNVVRGQIPLERAIRPAPGLEGVYVLPSGPVASNPGELLSSEEMAFTLRRARRWADVVLLDAPPVLAAADSSILGAYADGVVLVVAAGRTNRAQAAEAKDQLVSAGAQVLGVVLIGSDDAGGRAQESYEITPMGGGYGGWDAYDANSYDDWYGEEVVTASARMEPYEGRRISAPRKKTAAARPGQRPARQSAREQTVPRNARTRNGSKARSGGAARTGGARSTGAARSNGNGNGNGAARRTAASGRTASAARNGSTARKRVSPARVQTAPSRKPKAPATIARMSASTGKVTKLPARRSISERLR